MRTYIKYAFIFDPSQTWNTSSAFESDLAALFKAKGLKSELIEAAEGQETIPTIFIYGTDEVEQSEPPKLTIKK